MWNRFDTCLPTNLNVLIAGRPATVSLGVFRVLIAGVICGYLLAIVRTSPSRVLTSARRGSTVIFPSSSVLSCLKHGKLDRGVKKLALLFFQGSSMVEQSAVNRWVRGSSPFSGAARASKYE